MSIDALRAFVVDAYARAGFPLVRRTRVLLDWDVDRWDEGKRTVASCLADGSTIWLSPRLESFDRARQAALIAHEYGHAVQGFYGDVVTGHDAIERDADSIAEHVMGVPLFYAPVPGDPLERMIQTFDAHAPCAVPRREETCSVRPRPKGLRL